MSMNYYEDNPDELGEKTETTEEQEVEQASSDRTGAIEKAKKAKNAADNAKKIAEVAGKSGGKIAAKSSLAAAIGPVIGWAIVIILALIIIIGVVMFFITMPGMAMAKLKEKFHELAAGIASFFGADTTEMFEDAEIYSVLDYLEQMGYDLKGEGFLTDYCDPSDTFENVKGAENPEYMETYCDVNDGVFRYKCDDTIAYAKSDFIFQYIMSDNYVYTLKNDNVTTLKKDDGFWSTIWHGAQALFEKTLRFIAIPTSWGENWGKGLLAVYREGGSLGVKGDIFTQNIWQIIGEGKDTVEIDVQRKKLILQNNSFLNRNNPVEYDLTGWVGRYGMPLEFLLSIHKATGMPDLAYDMTIAFPTEVEILLREITGTVEAAYKGSKGFIKYNDYEEALSGKNEVWMVGNRQEWYKAISTLKMSVSDAFQTGGGTYQGPGTIPPGGYGAEMTFSGGNVPQVKAVTALLMGADHSENCACYPKGEDPEEMRNMYLDGDGKELLVRPEFVVNKSKEETEKAIQEALTSEEKFVATFYRMDNKTPKFKENIQPIKVQGYFGICTSCINHVIAAMDATKAAQDKSYQTFLPYIYQVKDHWFRDVYYVDPKIDDFGFVRTDDEFENVIKERWTLYETYTQEDANGDTGLLGEELEFAKKHVGEYKLYYIKDYENKDIDLTSKDKLDLVLWTDTPQSAADKGIKLTKKALTFDSTDTEKLEDVGWQDNDGLWSAYENVKGETHSGFKPAYPDSSEDPEKVKPNVYADVITTGNIVQKGEGLRGETNSKIKKMFMQANYFAYDGTDDTAEEILELRKKISANKPNCNEEDMYYGFLNKEDCDLIDSESKLKNGKVNESLRYRKVDFTTESLSAFSMLENTHTLDADFIYRDFKELIVELGYFDKEDLAENAPRLMAWIIPELGSNGWPNKELDNRENYTGAMAHSIEDYKANERNTIRALIAEMSEEVAEGAKNPPVPVNNPKPDSRIQSVAASAKPVGGGKAAKSPSQVSVKEFLDTTREMCEYMDKEGYDYCVLVGDKEADSPDNDENGQHIVYCDHAVHQNDCHLSNSFEESKASTSVHNVCCSTLGSWALQNVGVMPDSEHTNGVGPLASWIVSNLDAERIEPGEELKEGDYLFYKSNGHVDICGKKKSGGFEKYNGGHYCNSSRSSIGTVQNTWEYALRIPWGNQRQPGRWKGYEGNEAVVSPVTGILLDYGTYDKVEPKATPDPATTNQNPDQEVELEVGGDERLNLDLYLGSPNIREEERNQNNPNVTVDGKPEDSGIEREKTYEVYDQVGYAKILVLTPEIYRIIEQSTNNRWSHNYSSPDEIMKMPSDIGDISLVRTQQSTRVAEDGKLRNISYFENPLMSTEQMDEEHDNWSELDKTIYAYKEFAERYNKFGIAGYEVYIDGFVCETPDTELAAQAKEGGKDFKMYEQFPQGKPITIDTFKVDQSQVGEDSGDDEESALLSLYMPPKPRRLVSKKETDRVVAEETVKADASFALKVKNPIPAGATTSSVSALEDLILIKEGTVLGRTMTDKELIDKVRSDTSPEPYEEYRKEPVKDEKGKEENDNKVMGNYIRVTMKDEKNQKVEHVEDYFDLDEPKRADNDWELFFWLPFESGGADNPGCGPESQGTCSEGETAVGIIQWTVLLSSDMNNIAGSFIPGCLEENAGLCAPLSSYQGWSGEQFWEDYNGAKQFQACLKQICAVDRDEFLRVQMEVAKKQYLEPLLKNYEWLEGRPKCVQGAIMHLSVWGADTDWVGSYEGKSDEDILLKVRDTIANTGSTAGPASGDGSKGRAYNEPQIALEILHGNMPVDDVEEWVRTADYSILPFDAK